MEIDNYYITKTETFSNTYNELQSESTDIYQINAESKIYLNNIQQKANNSIYLPFSYNSKQIKYSNFTYDQEGEVLVFIFQETKEQLTLILYNKVSYSVKAIPIHIQSISNLPDELKNENFLQLFIYNDKRSYFKRLFTHLSFLHLNQMTNTIYIDNTIIVISSINRKHFIVVDISQENSNYFYYFSLDKLLHQISKIHFDFTMLLEKQEISTAIIKNSNRSSIYLDIDSYEYSNNYSAIVYNSSLYLVFYIKNEKMLNTSLLIYEISINERDIVYDMENDFEYVISKYNKGGDNDRTLISLISKIDTFDSTKVVVVGLSYTNHYFELVISDLSMNVIKKFTSIEFIRKLFIEDKEKEHFTIITDIFLNNILQSVFVVINFYYIVSINVKTFKIAMFNYHEESKFYLNLNKVFKGEYNKCLYLSICRLETSHKNKYLMDIFTKKNSKQILFVNDTIVVKGQNIPLLLYNNIDKISDLKQFGNVLLNNKKNYYFYLHLLSKYYEKKNKSNVFIDEIYKHNDSIIKETKDNVEIIDLINHNTYSGIMIKWFPYRFTCIKYLPFIKSLYFTNISKIQIENINIISPNPITTYSILMHNQFMIKYVIVSLVKLMIVSQQKAKNYVRIIVERLFKSKEERLMIYSQLKKYLLILFTKKIPKRTIINYNMKYELFIILNKALKKGNVQLFFHTLNKNIQYKDTTNIIKFHFFLLSHYYIHSKENSIVNKKISKYNIKDILNELEDNPINYSSLFTKYYIHPMKKPLKLSFNQSKEDTIIIMNFILILINKQNLIIKYKDVLYSANIQLRFISFLNKLNKQSKCNHALILSYQNDNIGNNIFYKMLYYFIFQSDIVFSIKQSNNEYFMSFLSLFKELSLSKELKESILSKLIANVNNAIEYSIDSIISFITSNQMNIKDCYINDYKQTTLSFKYLFDCIVQGKSLCCNNKELNTKMNVLYYQINIGIIIWNLFFSKVIKNDTSIKKLLQHSSNNTTSKILIYFKNIIVSLFITYNIWKLFILVSKPFLSQNEQNDILISLLSLSFYYSAKSMEHRLIFMKEIIDIIYTMCDNKYNNEFFYSNYYLYACLDFGNDIIREKIATINKYITDNKINGNISYLVKLNQKKDDFIRENNQRNNNTQYIFDFLYKNDMLFESFTKDFIKEVKEDSSWKKNQSKELSSLNESIQIESNALFNMISNDYHIDNILKYYSFSSKYMFYKISTDETKEKKLNEYINTILNRKKKEKEHNDILNVNITHQCIKEEEEEKKSISNNDDNKSTINNNNTVYETVIESNNSSIKLNEEIDDKNEDTKDISKNDNNLSSNNAIQLEQSKVLKQSRPLSKEEVKHIKKFNRLSEIELKCKYLSIKLLFQFLDAQKLQDKNDTFRYLKGIYYINNNNIVDKQISITLRNENEEPSNSKSPMNLLGRTLYHKLKIVKT